MKREKKPENPHLLSGRPTRRDFLVRCCQGALLLPTASGIALPYSEAFQSPASVGRESTFHLHPQYRSQLPLASMVAKVKTGSDAFVTEKYHDQLGEILKAWSSDLLRSPRNMDVVRNSLATDFSGAALLGPESRLLRDTGPVTIRVNRFASETNLRSEAFLQQLVSYLSSFSQLLTADFQITRTEAQAASPSAAAQQVLRTTIRYELVGSGDGFHREQRVGNWLIEWQSRASGEFRMSRWQGSEETQSRSASAAFMDVSAHAFGANPSYASQLLLGVDYWRTVLDGASGIDIYGHNGVSVGDIDNDGFDDLYVCQPAGLPNRLYRNRGDGTFEDVTDAAGVGVLENTACALFADVDNDGNQDLIVVRAGGPLLFINDGRGRFREKAGAFHFANTPQGTFTGAAIADYDSDGWLDIYFCLYTYYQGAEQYKYPLPYQDAENGPPNFLMRNNRDRTFRDVTEESGLNQNNTRYSFCCAWNDFDGDGRPDLYVVNDFGRKNLYRNNGNGTFSDVAAQSGVQDIGAGMSVCWFDYNNDGKEDLYVGNMWTAAGERITAQDIFQKTAPEAVRGQFRKHAMGNSLFRNAEGGKFQEMTASSHTDVGRWAWSCDAWDFDHDGFQDLYITNGMVSAPSREDLNSFFWRQVVANSPLEPEPSHAYEQAWTAINELIRSDVSWSGHERNIVYANNRDGSFADVSGALGLDFTEDGRSFALADVDGDGRQELFIKNRDGPQLRMMKNVIKQLPPSITFRLRGTKSNRDAIGAVVSIQTDTGRQTRTLQAGSGFVSQHSKEVFFGLGNAKGPVQATIRWPSGYTQKLKPLPVDHRIWVEEGSEPSRLEPFRAKKEPLATPLNVPNQFPDTAETWLLAPLAAPDFAAPDLNGKTRRVSALQGAPALLFFWSVQTPTWENELQSLSSFAERTRSNVIAVNVDAPDKLSGIRSGIQERGVRYPVVQASADDAAIYNILYRQLFDRHRDLPLPTAFLLDAAGQIVKVYQGGANMERIAADLSNIPRDAAERSAKALPFSGVTDGMEFRRNYLSYGALYYQRGYYEQAKAFFQRALSADGSSAEALYGLGSVYLQQNKMTEARQAFERVTAERPSYPDTLPNAWNNLGLLAAREGRTSDALEDFRRALQISPNHPIALVNLGNAYRQLKQWQDAREVLERAVAINPDDAEANYSLAMVYAQLDDPEHAYELLQAALRLRPDYPEALNNLGILYLKTGRPHDAVATFEKCMRAAPDFDQPYLNLARVYAIESNPEKARSVLQQLLAQHPGHEQAQRALAELGQ